MVLSRSRRSSRACTWTLERARVSSPTRAEALASGLDASTCEALARIDRVGLELAAESFAVKRGTLREYERAWHAWVLTGTASRASPTTPR